jgi:dihydrolipoamide dehydrogenase
MDAEVGDLGLTVHPHPTLSETVAFAAERAEGSLVELHDRPR